MHSSNGLNRAAASIAMLTALLMPIGVRADNVPLPPNLKAIKQAHAKAQAIEVARKTASLAHETEADIEPSEPPETVRVATLHIPLPVPRPRSLDPVLEEPDDADMPEQTSVVAQTPRDLPPGRGGIHALVNEYAARHGVPERLAHRVVMRESRYNPGLKSSGGHYGLMQISVPTARQMGYAGPPSGLLDARTNLAHAMPYLANAWLVSGGNEARAVNLYARGYYYDAKRLGLIRKLRTAKSAPLVPLEVAKAQTAPAAR